MTTPDIAALQKLVEAVERELPWHKTHHYEVGYRGNERRTVSYSVETPCAIAIALPAAREALERVEDLLQQDIHGLCVEANDYVAVEARCARLEAALRWALGEGEDFPPRGPDAGGYWWRSELRRRAALEGRDE